VAFENDSGRNLKIMELTEIYEKGKALLKDRDIGFLLDGVETEFVMRNNRRILDRYTFRQHCIDGVVCHDHAYPCHR
jgi:hypothetical protein